MDGAKHRRLVLVIDTDAGFTDAARQLLADERVVAARSIEQAVETVAGDLVDLALLGPSFGNLSSILSAGLLREADPGVTAVLVADVVTNRVLLAALRSGLVDVIDTPLTGAKLGGILERVPEPRESGTVVLEDTNDAPAAGQVVAFPLGGQQGGDDVEASSSLSASVSVIEDAAIALGSTARILEEAPPLGSQRDVSADDTRAPIEPLAPPTPPEVPDSRPREARDPGGERDSIDAPPPEDSGATRDVSEEPAQPAPPVYTPVTPSAAETPAPPLFEARRYEPGEGEIAGEEPKKGAPYPAFGRGRVVAVMAGKGGSGKTITATNLAIALGQQRGSGRVVLVDADLQFGDVALMLQLQPHPTVADVIARFDGLTDGRLDEMLLRHESGLRVIAAPSHPVPAEDLPVKGIVELIERLRGMYDAIVVDTPPILDDYLVALLEAADEVLTVVDMDVPSVKNAKIALESLHAGGFPMERIRLVVNRANAKARLDLVEMERSLGLRVAGSIPSDRLIPQAVNEGVPVIALSPRSRAARSFRALADLIELPEPRRSA